MPQLIPDASEGSIPLTRVLRLRKFNDLAEAEAAVLEEAGERDLEVSLGRNGHGKVTIRWRPNSPGTTGDTPSEHDC